MVSRTRGIPRKKVEYGVCQEATFSDRGDHKEIAIVTAENLRERMSRTSGRKGDSPRYHMTF